MSVETIVVISDVGTYELRIPIPEQFEFGELREVWDRGVQSAIDAMVDQQRNAPLRPGPSSV